MPLIPSTMLATSGLGAAIVAGWNQVKNIFSYISSLLIIKADLDETLSRIVVAHLKTEYKLLPSGLFTFKSRKLSFKSTNNTTIVPFRLPNAQSLYYGYGKFLFVNAQHTTVKLTAIRGFVYFNDLIEDALHAEEIRNANLNLDVSSRYQVIRVIGNEKGGAGRRSHSYEDEGTQVKSISGAPDSMEGDNALSQIDLSIDRSFMYNKEDYTVTSKDDPLDGLFFPEYILKYFRQAQQWFDMGDWYTERRIPWRRGWLLHGVGGTGKSSICKAVGQQLGIPVYQYFLGTLSDQEFMDRWERMNTPCIALFEDFDTIFNKRENLTEHKSLTFDCILNQISGVSAINGVFLQITTNHLENIDEAMGVSCGLGGISTRPGRIDSVIEVGMITKEERYKMAKHILRDWPQEIEAIVTHEHCNHITPVQFQEMCIQVAQKYLDY